MTDRSVAKADKPETIYQARTWGENKSRYLRYGLCVKCASQAAWGHQIGWGRLDHSPCATCEPIVQGFPQQSAHPGWRKVVHHSSLPAWNGEDREDRDGDEDADADEPCTVHGIRRCTICITSPVDDLAVAMEEGTPEWTV